MKNLLQSIAVVALLLLIPCVWANERIPPDPNDPELLQECWGVRPETACNLCHKVPMTRICGALPCNDRVIANQVGREAYLVNSGGNQSPVDGDGTPGVLCHIEEYVCTNGQCAFNGPCFYQYGISTAPIGPACDPETEPQ